MAKEWILYLHDAPSCLHFLWLVSTKVEYLKEQNRDTGDEAKRGIIARASGVEWPIGMVTGETATARS